MCLVNRGRSLVVPTLSRSLVRAPRRYTQEAPDAGRTRIDNQGKEEAEYWRP